jgi:pimeloyl-ACP methyl ester carboxylesterase
VANVIVGVPSVDNQPPGDILGDWWCKAIMEGLAKNCGVHDVDFEFGGLYWADLLYKYPMHSDSTSDFDSLYNDQPYVDAAPGALKEYRESWFNEARAAVQAVGGSVLGRVRGYEAAGLEWMLRDLAYYYDTDREIRDRTGRLESMRLVFMDELKNTLLPLHGRRIMVIAHSMGSIIAYDVLRNIGRENPAFEVAHFVTIGSPLGVPLVKGYVWDERKSYALEPLRTPTVVTERWVNYADRKDPVARDIHLRDDFGPNDRGIQVEDDIVLNDYISPNGVSNPHKSYGYLRTPELSEHIRDFIQS